MSVMMGGSSYNRKGLRRAALTRGGDVFGFGRTAGEDLQITGQAHLTADLAHDAQDVATDVVHPVGRQAFVNELADVDVFAHSEDAQEGRILAAEVFLVDIAQRFEVLSKGIVRFEPDEDRLVDQEFEQLTLPMQGFPCVAAELGRLSQADVARSRAFHVGLAVEGDALSFAEGIECD